MATNKQYPAEGMYSVLSAKTNPTSKNMLLAGRNGTVTIASPIIVYLRKLIRSVLLSVLCPVRVFCAQRLPPFNVLPFIKGQGGWGLDKSYYLKVSSLRRETREYTINAPSVNQKIATAKIRWS